MLQTKMAPPQSLLDVQPVQTPTKVHVGLSNAQSAPMVHSAQKLPLEMARQDFRLLYTAGLSIRMHTYAINHGIHLDMLRDINRWVIGAIEAEASMGPQSEDRG